MEMEPSNPLKEIFDELFSLLESLETQSMAVTQFLKGQRIGNDKKLAPYLEQAGNASSVKWRAARARMEYLLALMQEEADDKRQASEPVDGETAERDSPSSDANAEASKSADSSDVKPERKDKSTPEPESK